VQVLGISTDSVESHKRFRAELKLPFPLLSDPGGYVSKLYGIAIESPNGDVLSGRAVFLVDATGKLEYVDTKYGFKVGEADNLALMKAVKQKK
jgi:peroxiredoxin Q/BCP